MQNLIVERSGLKLIKPILLTNVNISPDNSIDFPKYQLNEVKNSEEDLIFDKKLTKQIEDLKEKIAQNPKSDPVSEKKINRIKETLKEFKLRYKKIKEEFLKRIIRVHSETEQISSANQLLNNLLPHSRDNLQVKTDILLPTIEAKTNKEIIVESSTITTITKEMDQAEFFSTLIVDPKNQTSEESFTVTPFIKFNEKTFGVWTTPKKLNILGKTIVEEETTKPMLTTQLNERTTTEESKITELQTSLKDDTLVSEAIITSTESQISTNENDKISEALVTSAAITKETTINENYTQKSESINETQTKEQIKTTPKSNLIDNDPIEQKIDSGNTNILKAQSIPKAVPVVFLKELVNDTPKIIHTENESFNGKLISEDDEIHRAGKA